MSSWTNTFVSADPRFPSRLDAGKELKSEVRGDLDILDTLKLRPKKKKGRNSRGDFIEVKAVDVRREG